MSIREMATHKLDIDMSGLNPNNLVKRGNTMFKSKIKRFKPKTLYDLKKLLPWAILFAIVGVVTLFIVRAATPGIPVVVNGSLPDPTNLQMYADDQAVTVTWDAPSNAAANNIVGYYITWGTQSGGRYTNAKQTTFTTTQVQPVTNGTIYNVKVQSVQGSIVQVSTPGAHDAVDYGETTAPEARANGQVSTGITGTVTPSSARVDQLRTQMTGFFDDFNRPAGAFDETKWNTAAAGCNRPGSTGSFINNQFHAHTQGRSALDNPNFTYCDRGQTVNRVRNIFDITGRTEADPGVMVFDFDGVTQGREAWYIDLLPTTVRANGVPLDVTGHNSVFNDGPGDPSMLRFVQEPGHFRFVYYDANKVPQSIIPSFNLCSAGWELTNFSEPYCTGDTKPVTPGLSPLQEMPLARGGDKRFNIPNVRQHYRFEISPTKIKVFINSIRMYEASMPAPFTNTRKFVPHVNLFSYNTGKDTDSNPETSILHWDNFGFNGPAGATVVHNYLEGGSDGATPYIGTGTLTNMIPRGPRTAKVNIPDPIGAPTQARIMLTTQPTGHWGNYTWAATDHVIVNGHTYNYPNPASMQAAPYAPAESGTASDNYTPYAQAVVINSADLQQGLNDITMNINTDMFNVHIELEYPTASAPAYTPPATIFGTVKLNSSIQPVMAAHDSYLFVEQDLGLPSGVVDGGPTTPPPSGSDTTPPTVNLTTPASNITVTSGDSFTASANASDDVGVSRVDFYIGNTLSATDNSSPYSSSISTTGIPPGAYQVRAVAFDAANNQTTSNSVTVTISSPPDTTAPTVTLTAPAASATVTATINVTATASDTQSAISSVSFYLDGSGIPFSTDNSSPYSVSWNSATVANGSHSIVARATDTVNNTGNSASVSFTVSNTVPDTTAPATSITSPTNNSTVAATITLQASASDNVGVSQVDLLIDDVVRASDTTSPYSFSWNTSTYTNGNHTLRTRAYDGANNSTLSAPIVVNVQNTVAPKAGDVNDDGSVNVFDLSRLLSFWNTSGATRDKGDLDGNGSVNIFDLSILLTNWG